MSGWLRRVRYDVSGLTVDVLACTVRGCGQPLAQRDRTLICPRGHGFDLARSGYVNLLQPQDRRSRRPGDSGAAVRARAGLVASGEGAPLVGALVERAAALRLRGGAVVVDLGSGSGDLLGALARRCRIAGIGIDISTAAADHAARRFPHLTWLVANADRRLPLLDGTAALVLSVHGRRNPLECARILVPEGLLLLALPADDDLIELREAVQGERRARARAEAVVAAHAPYFTPLERSAVRDRRRLDRDALLDLLRATYRGGRRSAAGPAAALDSLDVTLASDVLLFRRR